MGANPDRRASCGHRALVACEALRFAPQPLSSYSRGIARAGGIPRMCRKAMQRGDILEPEGPFLPCSERAGKPTGSRRARQKRTLAATGEAGALVAPTLSLAASRDSSRANRTESDATKSEAKCGIGPPAQRQSANAKPAAIRSAHRYASAPTASARSTRSISSCWECTPNLA